MHSHIYMCVRIRAKNDALVELREILTEMVNKTQKEPGLLFYKLYVDDKNPNVFYFFEGWENQSSLDGHNSSIHVKHFLAELPRLSVDGARVDIMHCIS